MDIDRLIATVTRSAVVIATLAAVLAVSGCGAAASSPAPTSTSTPIPFFDRAIGETIEKPEPTPEPVVEIPLDESAAPVEDAPAAPAPAPAPAPVVEAPAPPPAPVTPPPVLCPGGSSANSSDGYNDTSCMWDICYTISIPDAAHPECDATFRP